MKQRVTRQRLFLGAAVLGAIALVAYMLFPSRDAVGDQKSRRDPADSIPFPGERAYEYLKTICSFGRRPSGSQGMARQQNWLEEHFTKLGGDVSWQEWTVRHPEDGSEVLLRNLIVQWHPDRKDRILLCAHYDTRPFPDEDRRNPRGTFIGANDGASGVAVLCALGAELKSLDSRYGVDFVLFDAEELVFDKRRDPFFLGSEHFARLYRSEPPQHRYHWGVLLDMVGGRDLKLFQEINSTNWPDTRPLVNDIWQTAARLRVKEFVARPKHEVRDDHIALHDIAGIPTCDIIDFDFPFWHTQQDVPERCSAKSLAKVGWVLHEWLKSVDTRLPPGRKQP